MDAFRGEHQRPAPRDRLAEEWSADLWQKEKIDPDFVPEPRGLSRRTLLAGGFGLAATVAMAPSHIGKLSQSAKLSSDAAVGQFDYDPGVRRIHSHMKERYGIDFAVGPEKNQKEILGNVPSLEKYKAMLHLIKEEMFKYPPDMIRKIGEGRGFETRAIENLSTTEPITGMYDTEGKEIAGFAPLLVPGKPAQLLVNPGQPGYSQRQTLHHDLNHRLAIKLENPEERDRKWKALHKKITQNPYRRVSGDTKSTTAPTERYFLTQYASASPEEDQAVCAEWMMTPRLHAEFVRRRDNDPDELVREILAAKYELTIADYSEWSDGEMGRPFWDGVYRQGLKENAAIGESR
ncbi:MAG: hypothetical protein Q7R90_02145 [bacterium]|nr:hypothetical protein [bacterium]